jgi:nucleosome assembly protein 1-like 1
MVLKDEIGENDLPLLQHLKNIAILKEENSKNYSLVFEFSENEFFSNTHLKKRFVFGEDDSNPDYSESTKINWKNGKNITVKKI